jgi:hypothetical protein
LFKRLQIGQDVGNLEHRAVLHLAHLGLPLRQIVGEFGNCGADRAKAAKYHTQPILCHPFGNRDAVAT